MSVASDLAHKIIDEMMDRSGFDNWWGEFDEDIRGEIIDEITTLIREAMPETAWSTYREQVDMRDSGPTTFYNANHRPVK